MKRLRAALAAPLLLALILTVACASAERNAYRTIGTVSVAVDTAMKGWGEWVRSNRLAGTPVATATEAKVRAAYGQYQTEMGHAETAVSVYLAAKAAKATGDPVAVDAAVDAARVASVELVQLIFRLKGGAS